MPEIKLNQIEKYKATDFSIKVEKNIIDEKLKNLANEFKSFDEKISDSKSEIGDQIIFDYQATIDGKEFEGSEGKDVAIELGKDLFLKDFDKQLIGINKTRKNCDSVFAPKSSQKGIS